MRIILTFVFLVSFYVVVISSPKDSLNLGFDDNLTKITSWVKGSNSCLFKLDNKIKKSGLNSLRLSFSSDAYSILGASAKLCQSFLLPEGKKNINISVFTKGDKKWNACLNIVCLNNLEDIVSTKKLQINQTDDWARDSINIDVNDAKILSLTIELNLDKKYTFGDEVTPIWIDQIEIKIDNVDINHFEQTIQCNDLKKQLRENKVSFSSPLMPEISAINELKDKRIIALGETIHGSTTINKIAFQVIQNLVEKEHVKLIMFEFPIDLVMHWNNYISVKSSESIDQFLPVDYLCDPIELKNLLLWLRNYNMVNKDKVIVMGIDLSGSYKADFYLKRFLYQLEPSPEIDSMAQNLVSYHDDIYAIAHDYLVNHWSLFKGKMGNDQLLVFDQALKGIAWLIYPPQELYDGYRDYMLAQNAILGIDSLLKKNEKAIIYSHMQHASKICSNDKGETYPPMGSYLNKKYGKDYYTIGLLAGEGTFTANNDTMIVDNCIVNRPVSGSLEKFCLDMNDDFFFSALSYNQAFNNICYYRYQGAHPGEKSFYLGDINKRMDALIFTKSSIGFKIPKDWPIMIRDLMTYQSMKMLERQKNDKAKWH